VSEQRLISYPEVRAVEDTAEAQGAVPTRIFSLLLPVWRVEISSTITDGEDYELIDRHLERGIAEAGLDTPADLASFFGLDEVVVDRALRALAAIGHLTSSDGRLALTAIGARSVQDGVRYVVSREDRRAMYFEAFTSRPLTRAYYDARAVKLLSASAAQAAAAAPGWPRFQPMFSLRGFRPDALHELISSPERDRFNLPVTIDSPQILGDPECVFLPTYIVRAIQPGNRVRLFAYTQAAETVDRDLSELYERTAEIAGVLENEESFSGRGCYEKAVNWLDRQGLSSCRPEQLADGTWRATLPGTSFGPDAALAISKVGSFQLMSTDVLHLWCDDRQVRRQALVARMDMYLGQRVRLDRTAVQELTTKIARQLDLGDIDLPTLRQLAIDANKTALAAQLSSLV
jgi:hypothetical protein